ncbi:VWA domain-containing protein, partial [Aliarcobacter cryaerophilus]|uniref:vWA domain-containing protein n=1 Tax=Aliarcobacter cryaerophilus TaxID=28198 RepID=UPI003DA675A0
ADLTYSIDVPGSDLASSNNKVDATITITDTYGNSATDTANKTPTVKFTEINIGTKDDDTIDYSDSDKNHILIGDKPTTPIVEVGQNYNISFMVDSSGSMSATQINQAKASIRTVLGDLWEKTQGSNSGTVKVYISDFDSIVKSSKELDLSKYATKNDMLNDLNSYLNGISSGGGTNYEAAFLDAAQWFNSDFATSNADAKNVTYFITDGKPTYYYTDVNASSVQVVDLSGTKNDKTLKDVLPNNYKFGDKVTAIVNGVERTIVDKDGVIYKWTNNSSSSVLTSDRAAGNYVISPDGNGGYKISYIAGDGNSTTSAVINDSKSGFNILNGISEVNAIGIGSGVTLNDLKPYDTDGKAVANIDASKLAETILGTTTIENYGKDTIIGGSGDDIIFGDTLILPGQTTGISSKGELLAYVGEQLGLNASATEAQAREYILENIEEFDRSHKLDSDDVIKGGAGDDIIFGQGGKDTIYGEAGNDTIITDLHTTPRSGSTSAKIEGDLLIDGGEGFDTLILSGDNNIDFSIFSDGKNAADRISNIEAIDLTNGDHDLKNLRLDDVLNMTGSSKELIIFGDQGDSVNFKNTVGENNQKQTWSKSDTITEDGKTFEVYTNSGDESLKVKVEQPISDGITN